MPRFTFRRVGFQKVPTSVLVGYVHMFSVVIVLCSTLTLRVKRAFSAEFDIHIQVDQTLNPPEKPSLNTFDAVKKNWAQHANTDLHPHV